MGGDVDCGRSRPGVWVSAGVWLFGAVVLACSSSAFRGAPFGGALGRWPFGLPLGCCSDRAPVLGWFGVGDEFVFGCCAPGVPLGGLF
jgi:hypothetical protein